MKKDERTNSDLQDITQKTKDRAARIPQKTRGELSGIRVAQSLFFCVMVGRILVGFVLLNHLFSVSWLVDF
jgi:F0F1-type ATP synthase assembly protein I